MTKRISILFLTVILTVIGVINCENYENQLQNIASNLAEYNREIVQNGPNIDTKILTNLENRLLELESVRSDIIDELSGDEKSDVEKYLNGAIEIIGNSVVKLSNSNLTRQQLNSISYDITDALSDINCVLEFIEKFGQY